eukprot:m.136029 g.136029  ORF g.136029 m.136029 type:complete len:131 (-) comp13130_c0_seq6:4705-5097(-)
MRSVIRACGLASHLSWISSACLSSTVSSIPNNRLSQVFPQAWKGHRCASSTPLEYTQGQLLDKQREYFYFIDHNGFLFLDDTKMKNFTSQLKGTSTPPPFYVFHNIFLVVCVSPLTCLNILKMHTICNHP